ncbi:MAG: hypothetical protein U1F61_17260 [Opitutaceae bacterium]
MKTLFHLYAINRDGFRVTPKETETDRARVERMLNDRNGPRDAPQGMAQGWGQSLRWVAVEVERASGRPLGELNFAHN